jgi:hypothetical protein
VLIDKVWDTSFGAYMLFSAVLVLLSELFTNTVVAESRFVVATAPTSAAVVGIVGLLDRSA